MIPLLLGGAALSLIGGAVASSLDTDSRIESNLNKAFDPNLPPGDRQKAYNKALEINENRYNGESFADVQREEIDYAVKQKKAYEGVCKKIDKAFESQAISKEQHAALLGRYQTEINAIEEWLNK